MQYFILGNLMGKKTQQNFFTIDSTKYNVKMYLSITKIE